jgi:hypothetical protein
VQHLLQLRQRPQRAVLDPGHTPARDRGQRDRHRERLVVVELQGRQVAAGGQPVAAAVPVLDTTR